MRYFYDDKQITGAWSDANGIKYPANWIQLATQEELNAVGVITLEDLPIEPYVPTVDDLTNAVKYALQSEIDTKAQALGFSNGNSLMLYAGFTNPFKTLAVTFATWEATVWAEAEAYKAEVLTGAKPMLTGAEAVALMPTYPL